jgi:hypothetical protein
MALFKVGELIKGGREASLMITSPEERQALLKMCNELEGKLEPMIYSVREVQTNPSDSSKQLEASKLINQLKENATRMAIATKSQECIGRVFFSSQSVTLRCFT